MCTAINSEMNRAHKQRDAGVVREDFGPGAELLGASSFKVTSHANTFVMAAEGKSFKKNSQNTLIYKKMVQNINVFVFNCL